MRGLGDNAQSAVLTTAAMAAFTIDNASLKAVLDAVPLPQAPDLRRAMTTAVPVLVAACTAALRHRRARHDGGVALFTAWRERRRRLPALREQVP